MKSSKNSRAQITVFIIIGLIILIGGALVLYLTAQRAEPVQRAVSVPKDLEPIYDYVTTCVEQISSEGLTILGAQGGYINLPAGMARNPHSYIAADPNAVMKTPHWYYEGEDRVPTQEFVETELGKYVRDNLEQCVGDFGSFEQFDITPQSTVVPQVTLTNDDVVVKVNWDLEVSSKGAVSHLDTYISTAPVRLKEIRDLAEKIMRAENEQEWFETLTIDLYSANPNIPVSGMEFRCGKKVWHLRNIKDEMQTMLTSLLPLIRVENTQYPPPLRPVREYERLQKKGDDIREDLIAGREVDWPDNTPADLYQFNRMRFNPGNKRTDLKVGFIHRPEWGMSLNADPHDGGRLTTKVMEGPKKYLRFLCINQWHFAYDVVYPVKTLIRDDRAFRGDGYVFQFGFPVIIKDNDGERLHFGQRQFQAPVFDQAFCESFSTQSVDIRATGFEEGSLVAEELEDVNITYRCLNRECPLGETYGDGSGAIRLNTYLPEGCSTPQIIATKKGFLEGNEFVTGDKVEIYLQKLQNMNYTIMVHPYHFTLEQWQEGQTYTRFSPNMHASISISVRGYDQFKDYPADPKAFYGDRQVMEEFELSEVSEVETDNIDFVYDDAQYDIDIILFKGDDMIGGYHAENLTITYDELVGSTQATFHVVEWRPKDVDEAEGFLWLYEEGTYDGEPYDEALRPTFT